MTEQPSSRSQFMSFRPGASSTENQFAGNQPAGRSVTQPNVIASTPSLSVVPEKPSQSFIPEKPPLSVPDKPSTGTPNLHPDRHEEAGPVVAASQPETTAKSEPAKDEGGLPRSDTDKDTLSRLLSMIGCNSDVTLLMRELIKKDEQKTKKDEQKTKKEQTPPKEEPTPVPVPETPPVAPAEETTQPQSTEDETVKPSTTSLKPTTTSLPQTPPEPASEPDSAGQDESQKDSPLPEPATESDAGEAISTVPISSLSRLQKNYDSPDENAEKNSGPESEPRERKMSSASSQIDGDDEWRRSTEEFLSRLHSKSTTTSQKEKTRSTSRDKSVKDKPKTKTKTTEGKKSKAQQSEGDAKKAKAKRTAGKEVNAAEIEKERADLLRGKREIEGALELLQKELTNLRTNKKRLLESPSDAQRDDELSSSIENERKLTDHMSQLTSAMAELNGHLDKLSAKKVQRQVADT